MVYRQSPNYFSHLLFFVALLTVGTACSRLETDPPTTVNNTLVDTRSPELTNNYIKRWKIQSITLNDTTHIPIDSCRLDDEYEFHFDGFFQLDLGTEKCNGEETDAIEGNWHFQDDKTLLKIEYNTGLIGLFEVFQLDKVNLILQGNSFNDSGEFIGKQQIHFRALS